LSVPFHEYEITNREVLGKDLLQTQRLSEKILWNSLKMLLSCPEKRSGKVEFDDKELLKKHRKPIPSPRLKNPAASFSNTIFDR